MAAEWKKQKEFSRTTPEGLKSVKLAEESEKCFRSVNELEELAKENLNPDLLAKVKKDRGLSIRPPTKKKSYFNALTPEEKLNVYQRASAETQGRMDKYAQDMNAINFEQFLKESPADVEDMYVQLLRKSGHGGYFTDYFAVAEFAYRKVAIGHSASSRVSDAVNFACDRLPDKISRLTGLKRFGNDWVRPVSDLTETLSIFKRQIAESKDFLRGGSITNQVWDNLKISIKNRSPIMVYEALKDGIKQSLELFQLQINRMRAYVKFYKLIFMELTDDALIRILQTDAKRIVEYLNVMPEIAIGDYLPFKLSERMADRLTIRSDQLEKLVFDKIPAAMHASKFITQAIKDFAINMGEAVNIFIGKLKNLLLPVGKSLRDMLPTFKEIGDVVRSILEKIDGKMNSNLAVKYDKYWNYVTESVSSGKANVNEYFTKVFGVTDVSKLTVKEIDEMSYIRKVMHHAMGGEDLAILQQQKILLDAKTMGGISKLRQKTTDKAYTLFYEVLGIEEGKAISTARSKLAEYGRNVFYKEHIESSFNDYMAVSTETMGMKGSTWGSGDQLWKVSAPAA
eukprot:Pgem_evm1s19636